MIDKVATNLLAYFPEPNVTGQVGTNYNNYRKNVQSSTSAYQFDAKLDRRFNDNNRISLRYSQLHSNRRPTQATFVDDSYLYKTEVHNAVVDYTRTITPRIVYTGRLGLDLAIAPGITSYPDLTTQAFPAT